MYFFNRNINRLKWLYLIMDYYGTETELKLKTTDSVSMWKQTQLTDIDVSQIE